MVWGDPTENGRLWKILTGMEMIVFTQFRNRIKPASKLSKNYVSLSFFSLQQNNVLATDEIQTQIRPTTSFLRRFLKMAYHPVLFKETQFNKKYLLLFKYIQYVTPTECRGTNSVALGANSSELCC